MAGLVGLGLFGATTMTQQHPVHAMSEISIAQKNTISPIRYSRSYNNYLIRRVNGYAYMRRFYYHPGITYNTRALDRIPTWDYKYCIRPGMLYRSANLHYVTRSGIRQINRLGIKKDIDLRAPAGPNSSIAAKPQPGQIRRSPSRRGLRLRYYNYPVENTYEEKITWPFRKRFGESYRFYYWYALSPVARRAYHNAFNLMLNNRRGAIMYNCTQGRDRTGTLSVLIEAMLGVSKYNIYNDFLLTNHYKYQNSYLDQINRINTFYYAINRNYGSMWRYYHRGLGLSTNFINRFKRKFLLRIHVRV